MFPKSRGRDRARAVIVASGPSARDFIPPDNLTVFAVNGAIDWLPRADWFFTLDPSPDNLRRLTHQKPGVRYVAAGLEVPIDDVTCLRRISRRGAEPTVRDSPRWWLWRWSAVEGLSDEPGSIHSGNSAYGALGLAYHLGFTDVALVGVDGTLAPRVDGTGRPNNLSHLPLLFASALPQISVVSCGALTGIPRKTFKEWYASGQLLHRKLVISPACRPPLRGV